MEDLEYFEQDVIMSKEDLWKRFENNDITLVEALDLKDIFRCIEIVDLDELIKFIKLIDGKYVFYAYSFYKNELKQYMLSQEDIDNITKKYADSNNLDEVVKEMEEQRKNCTEEWCSKPKELSLSVQYHGQVLLTISHEWIYSFVKHFNLKTLYEYESMLK
ncbi:response regulator of citrate/malate metabolism [Breznakia sp. PF5-3]|uniref:hypothetical protein n=1 Tax=unclassified Breznakia TaxID=2623764 RepID=UPI00240589E2|nr:MULTISPECIES: hypothetical protein [unclassified Breznakia]MDF9824122.1 response regulator of citrate/malate metabolism [Breznakia sp. PM6-1]MDF9834920.1 response regulator of citrate/malate metabolism [Breznakia sp. PF5-3]MDF9837211.1 response regulator of citrate/malate metabolism [Breznakia sp. PFB2-8]MDF9859201.1 response regulator of citrate/malate metabolism [Breznakia sp. PH5-24]